MKVNSKKAYFLKNKYLYLMLVPLMVWYLVFAYLPMTGIIMSFQKYRYSMGIASPWVGLTNFQKIFSERGIWQAIRNTFVLNMLKLLFMMPAPVIFALLLNEMHSNGYKRVVQTITYLPYFISWVSLAGMITALFSVKVGTFNVLLRTLGLEEKAFLTDNRYFRGILIFTDVWKNFGYGAIVYLAALSGIDPTIYEAADIDGANRFQKILYITIPGIMSTFVIMLILNVGNLTNGNVDQVFNLYSPMVYETADTIDTFLLRRLSTRPDMGQLTAAGLAKSVVCLVMLVIANQTAYACGYEGIYSVHGSGESRKEKKNK